MNAERYNSIIIGAGHNGLICATYLAQQGQRVLVLEASDVVGGLAAKREFHPGFHASVAHSISHFPAKIARDLKLEAHGLKSYTEPLATVGLAADGKHIVLKGDLAAGASESDANSYRDYLQLMHRFARALNPFWLKTIPRLGGSNAAGMMTFAHIGLNLRRLGRKDMREFLRVVSLPTRDLMDEYFDSDILKAMLSWDGLIGLKQAPRSPNHSVLAMLYRMRGNRVTGLIDALQSSATAAGVEIRTGSAVSRVDVQAGDNGLVASGVHLGSGEQFAADRIVSSADPQTTFLGLVGVEHLEIGFSNRIRRLRCEGFVAKLHLALSELPEFTGLERPEGRMIIAPDMDAIEYAFDDAKYGECSQQPVLEVLLPSLSDASLAPEGQHVLSAHVMYVPHQIQGGWDGNARAALCERVIDTIANYAPGIREHIVHQEILTPVDLEQGWQVRGGHWHHTEFALDQLLMMRPTYEAAQYSTPLSGLYLCGAGCHPGGDVMGGPGHNAAREILR